MKNAFRAFKEGVKNLFVPTETNNSLPFLLSWTGISALIVGALLLVWIPRHFSASQLASLIEPFSFTRSQVVDLTNKARSSAGLPTLSVNPKLEAVAARKAEDMLAKQYFAHMAPDGVTPWTLLKEGGYVYRAAGENLALDFVTAEAAQAALMDSPSHRANILSPLYTEIGIAVAQGQMNGRTSIVVVEYFGTPKTTPTPTAVAVAPKPKPTPVPTPRATSTVPVATSSLATTRPTSTTVTSTLTIQPTPSTTVLGSVNIVTPTKIEALRYSVQQTAETLPLSIVVQIVVFALIGALMIAAALLLNRTHSVPAPVAFRTIAAIIILGYTATAGITGWTTPQVTPTSFATVSIVE